MMKAGTIGRALLLRAILVLAAGPVLAGIDAPCSPEEEKRIGREAAAEVMKRYEPVDDPDTVAKLKKMATAIGKNTPRPGVEYEIHYVKPKKADKQPEVNAFSLPGGIVFVLEGLVKECQSEHELAGVMAHEITHNVYYDGVKQAQRAEDIFEKELALVLAGVLVGGLEEDVWGPLIQAGLLYRQGVLGGYSIEMEKRADRGAVQHLIDTPWDPVGLLTFMERLAIKETKDVQADPGIYKTHPLSRERIELLRKELRKYGIRINRRHTSNWEKPKVVEGEVEGKPAHIVVYQEQGIFACIHRSGQDEQQAQRAEQIKEVLTEALAKGAQAYTFSVRQMAGQPAVVAYGEPILKVNEKDAELAGRTARQLAQSAVESLERAIWRENFQAEYGG